LVKDLAELTASIALNIKFMKGQSNIEFIIVLLFFIIITITLTQSYLKIFPSEASKAREQIACSQSETLAIQFLEFQGNETNWNNGGNLNELGFATENDMEINYNKIEAAKTRGYYNITTDGNLSIPFKLSYEAYAINFTNESIPASLPDNYNPRAFIIRNETNLFVYAGSNSTVGDFSINLFFPFTTITANTCDSGSLENVDTNITTSKDYGDEIKLNWHITTADLDCINLTLNKIPELIFIKSMSFKNTTLEKTFPIYLNNNTILNNEFGSSGDKDKDKNFCEIERVGLVVNGAEKVPVKFNIMSWR
jgi:hypothetical protein